MKNRKLLFITPYDFRKPSSGGEVRMYAIYSALKKQADVTLVTRGRSYRIHREGDIIFNKKGRFGQILNLNLLRYLKKEIRKSNIDTIFANTLWSGLMAVLLGSATGRKVVFDDHNIEFIRFLRTWNPVFIFVYLLEFIICVGSDKIIFVSGHDAHLAKKYLFVRQKKIIILNNGIHKKDNFKGVDFEHDFDLDIADKKKALFFGDLNYKPNRQALKIIQFEILPRLRSQSDIVFLVAGRGEGIKSAGNLSYLSFVPKIHNLIHSVDLVIAPLVSGSGTRLKILESIGMGTRVLSTKIGAEGIDCSVCGDNLELVSDNDWERFANRIAELVKRGKSETPTAFFQAYEWDNIIKDDFFSKI